MIVFPIKPDDCIPVRMHFNCRVVSRLISSAQLGCMIKLLGTEAITWCHEVDGTNSTIIDYSRTLSHTDAK